MEYEIESKLLKHLSKVFDFVEDEEASPYESDETSCFKFDLIQGTKGNIVLVVRDENGKKVGNIISLTREGKLKRYKNVDSSYGFKLNSTGQVALEK